MKKNYLLPSDPQSSRTLSYERGVGMVEVLVALLLLALGVIGFAALQVRAVNATTEGFVRTQGMMIATDFAERIRANRSANATYATKMDSTTASSMAANYCVSNNCTGDQLAEDDVNTVRAIAAKFGMSVAYPSCNAVLDGRRCVYVAWGSTKALESTTDVASCTNAGSYRANATCVMMEAY